MAAPSTTSATSYTVEIFTSSDYSTGSFGVSNGVTTSGVTGLRYIKLVNMMSAYTTHSLQGTIDDVQFWNNTVSPIREEATWNSNYKAVHHLQGNSTDSTTYGNDGTDTAVAYEQQNNSVGAGFNGSTSVIDVTADASITNVWDGGGCVSCTINPNSDGEGTEGRILDKRDPSSGWIIYGVAEASGYLKLKFYIDFSSSDSHWTTTNAVIPIGSTSDIAVIYNSDSLTNDPIFIINGVKYTVGNGLTETSLGSGTRVSDTSSNLHIGNVNAVDATFDGLIDNIEISNVSRPSSESITSYNAEKSDSDIITAGDELEQ